MTSQSQYVRIALGKRQETSHVGVRTRHLSISCRLLGLAVSKRLRLHFVHVPRVVRSHHLGWIQPCRRAGSGRAHTLSQPVSEVGGTQAGCGLSYTNENEVDDAGQEQWISDFIDKGQRSGDRIRAALHAVPSRFAVTFLAT